MGSKSWAAKLVKHENLLKSLLSLDRSNLTLLSMKWILKFTFKIKNLFNALKRSVVTPNEFRPSFTYLPMAPIICYVITQNAIFLPIFPHTTIVKEMFTFLCCRFSNCSSLIPNYKSLHFTLQNKKVSLFNVNGWFGIRLQHVRSSLDFWNATVKEAIHSSR